MCFISRCPYPETRALAVNKNSTQSLRVSFLHMSKLDIPTIPLNKFSQNLQIQNKIVFGL